MLLKYFNGNKLSVFIVIPVLMALCWVPVLVSHEMQPSGDTVPWSVLGGYLTDFSQGHSVLAAILAMMLIMANGFLLLQLNTVHIFIARRTQMPALFYMLLVSLFAGHSMLLPALTASFMIILMFFRVFATYKKERLSYNFLDAGLLVSLASLFYFPAVFFYPVLLILLYFLRPPIWREWVFTLIGLLLPYLFLFAAYYLTDHDVAQIGAGMQRIFLDGHLEVPGRLTLGFLAYVAFLLLVGSIYMITTIGNIKIQARKIFKSFLWTFIASLLVYFLVPATGIEMISFAALPFSFLVGYYFAFCRPGRINNLFLFFFLAGIAAAKIIT